MGGVRVLSYPGTATMLWPGSMADTSPRLPDAPAGATPGLPARAELAGIGLMLAAAAAFAGLDTTGKWLNQDGNPVGTAAVRYVLSFVLVALFIRPWGAAGVPRSRNLGLQVLRAGFLIVATLCSMYAYRALPMTQAAAISFVAPLIVAAIAGPLLGEWIGWRGALAVVAGFAGVLVITRPGAGFTGAGVSGAGTQGASLLALGTAGANALYIVATRFLAGRDSTRTTLFYTALVGAAVAAPALPFVWRPPVTSLGWAVTVAMGVLASVGHWLMILAHRRAPASLLAPFGYAQLLWAGVLGGLVFGEVPDRWTLVGGAVVIGAGLYLLSLQRRGR